MAPVVVEVMVLLFGSCIVNGSDGAMCLVMCWASLCLSTVSVAPLSAKMFVVSALVLCCGGDVDNAGVV